MGTSASKAFSWKDPRLSLAPLSAASSSQFLWRAIPLLFAAICAFAPAVRSQQSSILDGTEIMLGDAPAPKTPTTATPQQPESPSPGNITGRIVDVNGAPIVGANVKLVRQGQSPDQEVLTGDDGQFSLVNVPAGPFQLIISGAGFATQQSLGMVRPGETFAIPQITLAMATNVTEVQVVLPRAELAEAEMRVEEKQRVLGVLPNFYVTYVPNAVPLNSKQKFRLAWKATIDPANFVVTGAVAGVQQAQNDFKGYGQGGAGYARRYGADFADSVAGTFIGGAVFPSLLKQDPRYFYKGTGSVRSRILYAVAHTVICKGDNGRWQPNYSNFLGSIAAGGISNLYYPDDKVGTALTFENAAINIASGAAIDLVQEFVMKKFTSHVPNQNPGQP
jgi:carboxypeptidase family protein